ncbi:MAG TPA: hypothetical protein VGP84_19610 [Gemmatimonadaceae bacterium]|jgi:hypothetical protein|nr:hypothetical protein [Gemmatimonadaceae bacterium]
MRVRLLSKLAAQGTIMGRGFASRGVTLWQRESFFVERSRSRGNVTSAVKSGAVETPVHY